MNGHHTTSINDSIEPSEYDILSVAEQSGLDKAYAKHLFEELKDTVCNSNY